MKNEVILWFIAPTLFFLTTNPFTGSWKILFALLALLWIIIDLYFIKTKEKTRKALDLTFGGLMLVGATNWFFSPFFFLLYFLIVYIALVFTFRASIGFTISLFLILVLHIGEIDKAYDSLVLLSLLGTIFIARSARKEYTRLLKNQRILE